MYWSLHGPEPRLPWSGTRLLAIPYDEGQYLGFHQGRGGEGDRAWGGTAVPYSATHKPEATCLPENL